MVVDRYNVGGSPRRERNRRAKFKNQLNVGYVNGYADGGGVGVASRRGGDVRCASDAAPVATRFRYVVLSDYTRPFLLRSVGVPSYRSVLLRVSKEKLSLVQRTRFRVSGTISLLTLPREK